MNIIIKNCNNIDAASISQEENKLNIKFAPNGTGRRFRVCGGDFS